MRKRVYVAYAGGTIGMRATDAGYAPVPGYLSGAIADRPELHEPEVPELVIHEHDPLLDSAAARPADWLRIAADIAARADDFDGFVVLHGTDTMAYTASALAFLLRGLGRPVVITGAQIPLGVLRSDGRQNLLTAVLVAARDDVREVCLVFGSRILRGCRAVKESATGFEAFASPNEPPLGRAGVAIELDAARLRPVSPGGLTTASLAAARPVRLPAALDVPVGLLRVYPGMPAATLAESARGLVIEAYGAGTMPALDLTLARDTVVVAVSQCLDGRVDLGAYAASAPLVAADAVGGLDMTSEAAYAKLVVLLAQGRPAHEVRALMAQDLCGELTPAGG
jgi:L-asparaginase